jgi:hypothetical protein
MEENKKIEKEDKKNLDTSPKKKKELSFFWKEFVPAVVVGILLILLFFYAKIPFQYLYEKDVLKQKVKTAISNDSDLETIVHIFDNKVEKKYTGYDWLIKDADKISEDLNFTLINLLNDLKADYFLEKDTLSINSNYKTKLDKIILEHIETNPFDILEEPQKYFFESIRTKLDSNYLKVEDDLLKITDELERKNSLTNDYLAKSRYSFWIAIFALTFSSISLCLGLYNQWLNQKRENRIIKKEKKQKTEKVDEAKSNDEVKE